jgi:hypothetical protein
MCILFTVKYMYILFSQIRVRVHVFDFKQNGQVFNYRKNVYVFDWTKCTCIWLNKIYMYLTEQSVHVFDWTFCSVKYMYILFSQIHGQFVQSNTCIFCSVNYMYIFVSQIHVHFVQSNFSECQPQRLRLKGGRPKSDKGKQDNHIRFVCWYCRKELYLHLLYILCTIMCILIL